jgi:hypothetical protein
VRIVHTPVEMVRVPQVVHGLHERPARGGENVHDPPQLLDRAGVEPEMQVQQVEICGSPV